MTILEAINERHSVRQYKNIPLETQAAEKLEAFIADVNRESGLHIQLVKDEPRAFDSGLGHYGNFKGVSNYLALVGKREKFLAEKAGYYGEKVVLEAQRLGINSCWVALTFKKIPGAFKVDTGEKFVMVISLGYGETQGHERKTKTEDQVTVHSENAPAWFREGVKAALKAPTAMNQQKFTLAYENGKVKATAGLGPHAKTDLGIVKYHFEIGAGKDNTIWE